VTQTASVLITNPTGLHARPAVRLAQLAARFDADVELRIGDSGDWVRARSAAKIMKLKAGSNTMLHLRARGTEAADALREMADFVRRDFDEGAPGDAHNDAQPARAIEDHAAAACSALPARARLALEGTVLSRGLALGRVHRLAAASRADRAHGDPQAERAALLAAMRDAAGQLRALAHGAAPAAQELMAFQLRLLEDEDFVAPAFEAVHDGTAASDAWQQLMDGETAEYEAAESEYFRERAADLRDLRDRVADTLAGGARGHELPDDALVLADELTPSRFLELDPDRLAGIVTRTGGPTGHAAMLARACRVPWVSGIDVDAVADGAPAVVDAEAGRVLVQPDPATVSAVRAHLEREQTKRRELAGVLGREARTATGRRLLVYLNVDDPALVQRMDATHCDGVGLTRTEFLFQGRARLPDEEQQYRTYRRLLQWADGRPVTIRTLDAGGDKPVPGLTLDAESNPFLGVRGVRLSLVREDVFRVQLRALLRSAVHGRLKVMLPMVTLPEELARVRELMACELEALAAGGVAAAMPALGIMVEVPAAALAISAFDADFYSIGSNDLTQYLLATSRDAEGLAGLRVPFHPALRELIERVVAHGTRSGAEVSLCGELAADAAHLPALLGTGLRALSVPAAALGPVKAAIAAL